MANQKRIAYEVRTRARGLLDMMYTPLELADELGLPQQYIYRQLIPAGLPYINDATGHLWLHGPEVARWLAHYGLRQRAPLQADEAYCLKCHQVVVLVNSTRMRRGKFT